MKNEKRREVDASVNRIMEFAMDHIPEGWALTISLVADEASMMLYDPDEESVKDGPSDGDFIDHVLWHVNYARKAEGLSAVEWEDES